MLVASQGMSQLPGSQLIQWDFASSLGQFSGVAAVLAGFSFTVIGLLAVRQREQDDVSRQYALAALLPGVLALVLSAYLYSEAAGSTDDATTLLVALGAAEALAVGALAAFLAFALMIGHQSQLLYVATRWVFWSVAAITTAAIFLGQWTFDEALFNRGSSPEFALQGLVVGVGFLVACLAARRGTSNAERLVKTAVLAIGTVCALGIIPMVVLSDRRAPGNVATARDLAIPWSWLRVLVWVAVVVAAALALPESASDDIADHQDGQVSRDPPSV